MPAQVGERIRSADRSPSEDVFDLSFRLGCAMRPEDVIALALLLPKVVRGAHNGNPDFRVGGRIFATLWTEEDRVVLRLTPALQTSLIEDEPDIFAPAPGSWGGRGWTNVDLASIDEEAMRKVLLRSWSIVAPPGLVAAYGPSATRSP